MSCDTWDSGASRMETLVDEYIDRGLLDEETTAEVERLIRQGNTRRALDLAIERKREP